MAGEESASKGGDNSSNSNDRGGTSDSAETSSKRKMISLTIKTLDSQNHKVADIDEESLVKDFKVRVAETVGIPWERQRMIHAGKVLADGKKLKEYSLDGKVVHLVQRATTSSNGKIRRFRGKS